MPRRFDFISPGVSIREVDQSTISAPTTDDGILLIGHAPQGPANVPIKVNNLEDFYRVFGKPVSGKGSNSTDVWRDGNRQATAYAMYAAQAWLASGTSPVTFIRLLGQDQLAAKQASGYVKAGWDTTTAADSATAAGNSQAYGLFIAPSASASSTAVVGTLAAIIYATASVWALSGNIEGTGDTTAALNTLIKSSTGVANTFTLVHSSSTVDKKYVVHFDKNNKDGYIRNVLNCNPQKTKAINYSATDSYFLGETFEESVSRTVGDAGSGSAGQQYGILIPLTDGTVDYADHLGESLESKTGWFINRNPSPTANFASYTKSTHEKLFRLCSLHEGEWFAQNYGVRIESIRVGSTANPTSTFTAVIVNSSGEAVETFANLNLDESSADFIGKRIGDQYQSWNSDLDKYMLHGEYPNRSDYVRVEMAEDWKQGISDNRMVPFGVFGPMKPNTLVFQSGSVINSNTLGKKADDGTIHLGHTGNSGHFAFMDANLKFSLAWPDLKLTDESSNNSGNYTKDYVFGVRHMFDADNKPKKTLWDSADYRDLVRALPNGLDIHTDGTKTQSSWIFSLDDLREEVGTNKTKFYYENGSHAAGNSFTGNSGSALLITQGIRQFNAPFFGGKDGLDIRQVEPFSVGSGLGLASGQDENKHYAYHSVKRVFEVISDKDLMSYDIVSMPGLINSGLTQDLIRIAEERADTLAIIDLDGGYRKPYEASGVEALGSAASAILKAEALDYDTSYAATYYPPVRLLDTAAGTEDVTVVPPSVAAIGAIAKAEATSQGPWFAPAGFNRGGIGVLGGSAGPRVVGSLEHLTKKDRDDLYEQNINPIARFPSIGEIVIFGQKTLQQTPSALDRINVRRLMIYLKKRIGRVADTILFDQNVQTTWFRFKTRADVILADVKARFGITEYKLILDETTTTADLVDRNIMYAKIFIKPARAIEFIAIDFVITKSGVEF